MERLLPTWLWFWLLALTWRLCLAALTQFLASPLPCFHRQRFHFQFSGSKLPALATKAGVKLCGLEPIESTKGTRAWAGNDWPKPGPGPALFAEMGLG